MSNILPTVFTFWSGPLSWLERLSIQSFLARGHRFTLYGYERPEGLPEGCEWRDASQILPRERMFFYKNGRTPATFADLFRLAVMKRSNAIWVDCDMICLRPFEGLNDYVFGYETAPSRRHRGQINNAVLRLPSASPLLDTLLNVFAENAERIDPVWMPRYRRVEIAVRRAFGHKIGLGDFQFGATGPFPLTYFARQHGIENLALPVDVFYPLPYSDAPKMLLSGTAIETYATENTLAIHLWRMRLTDRSRFPVPPRPEQDSALAKFAKSIGCPLG